jgi:hypothetical protein
MSTPTTRTNEDGQGSDGASLARTPRLSLRRERVKSLRVAAGVRTGCKGCGNSGTNPICTTSKPHGLP